MQTNDNRELLESVVAKAQQWLAPEYDLETRNEVQRMLDNEDKTELIEAFYKELEFGTGGLRGIMGAGCNRMNRYTVSIATQGLSNYLHRAFPETDISVVIGHDCRNNSRFFAETAASVFSANNIKVYLFDGLRPTPEISFAIRKLGCQSGVMVTASHNPKEYNGYKAYWNDGAQIIAPHDVNIIDEVTRIHSIAEVKTETNPKLIQEIGTKMDTDFINAVVELSLSPDSIKRHHDMGIVYTPIHGTGMRIVPRTLRQMGFSNVINVPEQDVISGDFPTVVSPNPEEPAALELAIKRAEETGADLVLASDPDGDRLGVAVRNKDGKMYLINGNQICALLTYYSIVRRSERGEILPNDYVVKTIVTTEIIPAIAQKYGVELYDCYTGFKWIAHVIRQNEGQKRYIGGGEESYGYLWEDFIRDKSTVSACAMFAEMAAWALDKGLTIDALLLRMYQEFGYFLEKGISVVRKGRTGAEEIAQMMTKFRNQPPTELAGERITEIKDFSTLRVKNLTTNTESSLDMPATSNVLQFRTDNGTILSVRPSGTEPKIKFYIGVQMPFANGDDACYAEQQLQKRIDAIRHQLSI